MTEASRVKAMEDTSGRTPAGGEPVLRSREAAVASAARQPTCWRYGAVVAQSQGGGKWQNLCSAVLARLGNV